MIEVQALSKSGSVAKPPSRRNVNQHLCEAIDYWNDSRPEAAVKAVDLALKADSADADALCFAAYMLGALGRPDAAIRFYQRAVEFKSDFPVAWLNLGKLHFQERQFRDAQRCFVQAVELAPLDADAWNSYSAAERELGRYDKALSAAQTSITLRASSPEAHVNLGNALFKLNRVGEARQVYERASQLDPCSAIAWNGLALCLKANREYARAMHAFGRAIELGDTAAISGKACLQLLLGDFENGWQGYEARWLDGVPINQRVGDAARRWNGVMTAGLTVLVINDHGRGDTFQFYRFIRTMCSAGVKVIFCIDRSMHEILRFENGPVFVETPPSESSYDCWIPLSSIPGAVGVRLSTIPATVPYLYAEHGRWRRWMTTIGSAGFKVGLVWQGSVDPNADASRAFRLDDISALCDIPGVRIISLQKGVGEEQLRESTWARRIETLGVEYDAGADAFMDCAAAIENLDLVICCDTSVAHLAGAMGAPVWIALKFDAEWRWLTQRSDSPWYPSARLFRQERPGDWQGVFAAMAAELREIAARAAERSALPHIPVSIGELCDKISILELKKARIQDAEKLGHVNEELNLLVAVASEIVPERASTRSLRAKLDVVNAHLWNVEDQLRELERLEKFDQSFIGLARSVYRLNDERALIKRNINAALGSDLVEEKSYASGVFAPTA